MMDWSAAVASDALLSSIFLGVALFVVLGLLFGFGWRTGAVVVAVVIGVNVFCEGGAPLVIAAVLRPFHTLATTGPPPEPPADHASHWPNG